MSSRSRAFTYDEINTLLSGLEANKELITKEFNEISSSVEQKKTWQLITNLVNEIGSNNRKMSHIKKKWYDLKSRTKSKFAKIHQSKSKKSPTSIEKKVLSLIGKNCVESIGEQDTYETFNLENEETSRNMNYSEDAQEDEIEMITLNEEGNTEDIFLANIEPDPSCSTEEPNGVPDWAFAARKKKKVSKKKKNDDAEIVIRNQTNILNSLNAIQNVMVEMKNLVELLVENSNQYNTVIIELLKKQNALLCQATGMQID